MTDTLMIKVHLSQRGFKIELTTLSIPKLNERENCTYVLCTYR